jgi:lambda family phage portal protein
MSSRQRVRVQQFGAGEERGIAARLAIYAGTFGAIARGIDNAIGLAFPRWAHGRRQARLRSAAMLSMYQGARSDRLQRNIKGASADAELLPDLQQLRDRARAMVRDDAHMSSAVQVLEENVVGTGLTPKPHVNAERAGITQDQADAWTKACEQVWEEWSEYADSTEDGTHYDLQRLALRGLVTDGEALGHTVFDDDGDPQVELVDVDRLISPGLVDTPTIRGGVENDARGAPVAYHILPNHPDDIPMVPRSWKPDRFDKRDGPYEMLQHVFRRVRPGQTRGCPPISAGIAYLRGLHDVLDSEMTAIRGNSKLMALVTRPQEATDTDIAPVSDLTAGGERSGAYLQELVEGTIEYLEPGEDIRPFIPNRPGTTFDPFVVRSLRAICASYGLSYELVARDLGGMNFASSRGMFVECRRGFDMTRIMVVRKFCQPHYRNLILARIADGRLVPPAQFLDNQEAFLRSRWQHPAYGWVDPVKEVLAEDSAIAANLGSPYDAAQRAGLDAEQVLEEKARLLRKARELEQRDGFKPGTLTPSWAQAKVVPPPARDSLAGGSPDGQDGGTVPSKTEEPAAAGASQ